MRARTSFTVLVALALAAPAVLPVAAAASPPRATGTCTPGTRLLGFTDDLDKTAYAGLPVAGLSALARAGGDRFLALVDNVGTTPARFYSPRTTPRSVAVTGVTVLRRADGTPYTGTDFDGEGWSPSAAAGPCWPARRPSRASAGSTPAPGASWPSCRCPTRSGPAGR